MVKSGLQFIERTTYGLKWYVSQRGKQGFDRELFEDMICHIMAVLSKWTGETWVGHKKDKRTETVFQNFFETFVNLIEYINFFEKMMSDMEKEFANMTVYNGVLYRYLGSCSPGIGEKRKKALMDKFKSVKRMKEAEIEELCEVEGITRESAIKIKNL